MKHFYNIFIITALCSLLAGCNKLDADDGVTGETVSQMNFDEARVLQYGNVMFGDMSRFDKMNITKGNEKTPCIVTISSLIDEKETKCIYLEGYKVNQIPFKSNAESRNVFIGGDTDNRIQTENIATVKKFLLEFTEIATGKTIMEVVTMIASSEYISREGTVDFTWENRAGFCGYIFYHNIKGELLDLKILQQGRIIDGDIFLSNQNPEDGIETEYITIHSNDTRACNVIEEAYCIAYLKENLLTTNIRNMLNMLMPFGPSESMRMQSQKLGGKGDVISTCSKVSNKTTNDEAIDNYCIVALSSSSEYVTVEPVIERYVKGSTAYGMAMVEIPFAFGGWRGDITSGSTTFVIRDISHSYQAMACIKNNIPCVSGSNGSANPLRGSIRLAPTDKGNYYNALYDKNNPNRNAGCHEGVDLACPEGTPIYAMYDGIVVGIVDSQTEEYNRIYPRGYGNTIIIRSCVNGKEYDFLYAHLQWGNAIAENSFTHKKFEVGNRVIQGQHVANSGRSGNAVDIKNPHLHLGVSAAGTKDWIDPAPFLNGNIIISQSEKSSKWRGDALYLSNINCPE